MITLILFLIFVFLVIAVAVLRWNRQNEQSEARRKMQKSKENVKVKEDEDEDNEYEDAASSFSDNAGRLDEMRLTKFSHRKPRRYYSHMVSLYDRPWLIVNRKGGFCIWKNKGGFKELVLKDEFIRNSHLKHARCEFLYGTVRAHIPEKALSHVLHLSPSITYDRLLKHLTVRGDSMEFIIGTTLLAMTMAENPKYAEKYAGLYGSVVAEATGNGDTANKMKDALREKTKFNHKKYQKYMKVEKC